MFVQEQIPGMTHELIAGITLAGMGLDVLGGCYLAYDLLGGKQGPLRIIARATNYVVLFFIGYIIVLGLRYALVAASGMGILLAIEFRLARSNSHSPRKSLLLLFGFLRGLVLGLAGMTMASSAFGMVFGLLSGAGLVLTYLSGFAPAHDYETHAKPHLSKRKVIASLLRAIAVSAAGLIAAFLTARSGQWALLGIRLGFAAGIVSALVGLFSPSIEWRIENLPERRLGVIGLVLIFLGVLVQSLQYWIAVYNIPVT
jgi:hypothetical protein